MGQGPTFNKPQACVIIDDPLLRENYGFLNYRRLLDAMERYNFHSTIAFIPWNYERTDPEIARLFIEHPDRLSLCVHGCNHTKSEFGSADPRWLNFLAGLALQRMNRHQELSGIPFDKVMIFPQGDFSTESMAALAANGYLAAVNHIHMIPDSVSISSPAILEFGIPLLVRRDIDRIEDLKSDLSSGRPALIMLHHNSFRYKYDKVGEAIEEINRIGNIQWGGLSNIVENLFPDRAVTRKVPELDNKEGYDLRIFLRRHLCEFRDNYLSKSRILAYVVNRMHSKEKRLIDY